MKIMLCDANAADDGVNDDDRHEMLTNDPIGPSYPSRLRDKLRAVPIGGPDTFPAAELQQASTLDQAQVQLPCAQCRGMLATCCFSA